MISHFLFFILWQSLVWTLVHIRRSMKLNLRISKWVKYMLCLSYHLHFLSFSLSLLPSSHLHPPPLRPLLRHRFLPLLISPMSSLTSTDTPISSSDKSALPWWPPVELDPADPAKNSFKYHRDSKVQKNFSKMKARRLKTSWDSFFGTIACLYLYYELAMIKSNDPLCGYV